VESQLKKMPSLYYLSVCVFRICFIGPLKPIRLSTVTDSDESDDCDSDCDSTRLDTHKLDFLCHIHVTCHMSLLSLSLSLTGGTEEEEEEAEKIDGRGSEQN